MTVLPDKILENNLKVNVLYINAHTHTHTKPGTCHVDILKFI